MAEHTPVDSVKARLLAQVNAASAARLNLIGKRTAAVKAADDVNERAHRRTPK